MQLPIRAGLATAVVALTLAPAASAAFSPPTTISGPGASPPAVAVGSNGAGVVVWTRFDGLVSRVVARTVSASGVYGPAQTLSEAGGNAFTPQAAVDADGDAIIVWSRLDGSLIAQARRISAAGVLGAVHDLSPAGEDASAPQVAINADGDAIAVWFRANVGERQVLARTIPNVGAPGPVLGVSTTTTDASQPRVAVSPIGDGYVAWLGSDGSNTRAQGRTIDTAGNRGQIRMLSPSGADASDARVDVDQQGNAFVLWTRDVGGDTRVQGRPVAVSGAPGTVTTLSAAGGDSVLPAISISGINGVAVWRRTVSGVRRIQAVELSPIGGTGAPANVSPPGDATNPGVVADSSANSYVIWQRSDGSNQRVQVRPWSSTASLAPVQTLSGAGADATVPVIAMNPAADSALAAWLRDPADGLPRIQTSRGP